MKTSESIKQLSTSLCMAQGAMTGAIKSSKNPFFKSSYSDLSAVIQAVSKPFFDNELCFSQGAEYQDGMLAITTRIMHVSGEWIEATTILPAVKNDPQAYGSSISYGRRYGLQSLAGLPSVDDDGNYASAIQQKQNEDNAYKALAMTTNQYREKLNEATNMDELIATWTATPKKCHAALVELKNELKDKYANS
jgi:hypothetical protein